ncbi:glutaminyl-peptide cyclotransferase [Nocardia goodfellowii]|uniref:Glutamine cyclotransferase n=1 Tax=Nocardia goodfellowii TaxID=882446 RepID=A0ABS4Q7A4_9NOCA|nr:glutaminyl-peptide cyclotransferase [Nocardia goodfellowii]MBP2187578.1 glutamine cyclotransferase [Nocardia goodfellowii]
MERNPRSLAMAVLFCLLTASGCTGADDAPPELRIEVVGTRPHDPRAFTQGLEISDGVLYESTGLTGASWVRASDLATGAELARAQVPGDFFGEGITRAGATLWQLTWKDNVAYARDPASLAVRGQARYDGEGWGLCTRGERLVMSDGTATLTFRDPISFAVTGTVALDGYRGAHLNELDCAPDGSVYANDYPTDRILRIDPESGRVLGVIDARGLLTPAERARTDVLNGIAHLPGTDRFLVTGKYWPTIFEVRFVPV